MTTIPPFPVFRRLEIGDREAIEGITRHFPPYSDFVFNGLWAWDTDERCAIAMLGDNLVFRLKDYSSEEHFYAFLGKDDVVEASATLLAHARQVGLLPQLKLIPEEVIAADDRLLCAFTVDEDRDNFDYLYAVDDWARFPTPRFRTHRKMLKCCREQAAMAWQRLDVADPDCQAAMSDVFRRWEEQKLTNADEQDQPEHIALQRLFALPMDQRLAASGAFDGERLAGFTIWEALPGGAYAVGHFQKADRAYKGLSSWQAHTLGQRLMAEGYRLFNAEQDLGIPGLRAHKLSLRPATFLRKYVIAERGATPGVAR